MSSPKIYSRKEWTTNMGKNHAAEKDPRRRFIPFFMLENNGTSKHSSSLAKPVVTIFGLSNSFGHTFPRSFHAPVNNLLAPG